VVAATPTRLEFSAHPSRASVASSAASAASSEASAAAAATAERTVFQQNFDEAVLANDVYADDAARVDPNLLASQWEGQRSHVAMADSGIPPIDFALRGSLIAEAERQYQAEFAVDLVKMSIETQQAIASGANLWRAVGYARLTLTKPSHVTNTWSGTMAPHRSHLGVERIHGQLSRSTTRGGRRPTRNERGYVSS